MKKTYYLFNPGRLSRKDNTLKFTPIDENKKEGKPRYLPVNQVSSLFIFGSLDANSALYNFLAKNQITAHFFDYYEHYTGSFMPKDYLLAGKVMVNQTLYYHHSSKRMNIAQSILHGGVNNMLRNLKYYLNRDKPVDKYIQQIQIYQRDMDSAANPQQLMGIEGNIRQVYYGAFDEIVNNHSMAGRSKQPPLNIVNALMSFGNMMCYTLCLDALYHTQLNPTISFLHEPGTRRYSLALDLAEIFKPLLIDRLIFSLLNKGQIQQKHFEQKIGGCFLNPKGKEIFIQAFDKKVKETIKHNALNKSVSYKHLVKLECYKLSRHIMGIDPYKPFKAWW
ncbi:type I-B CRISPR-associated endonuclease Cas1b [Aureibacter tunicatorum]|uniref:CRISPR-associated endonuclease Cas1 n=1 Tax=Aureibacter tunicatorum TaxID=866807 RepID=A0AAE4BUN2_9BACT|nr:type I-B CRISPR-associated endonuclease Cas1b [Aureibacter tunicatorum]MDR6241946.1 CRISPR-associated protein Cas1 [Aureibacter tunicatorum]BDD07499.1 CRISPR-associated endonuclease Cas1 [Aureibacter tunicatorum]